MALQPGDRLGPFEVDVLLGVGGMGEVYRGLAVNGLSVRLDVPPALEMTAPW